MVKKVRQVDELIAQLKVDIELETKAKNAKHSFDVEYKVREHVKAILKQVLLSDQSGRNDYRIESERAIPIYDQKDKKDRKDTNLHCRPDFEIMLKNDNQCMLTVEVKRIFPPLHTRNQEQEVEIPEKPLDEALK